MTKRPVVPKCIRCVHFLAGSYCNEDFHVICREKGDAVLPVPIQCDDFEDREDYE